MYSRAVTSANSGITRMIIARHEKMQCDLSPQAAFIASEHICDDMAICSQLLVDQAFELSIVTDYEGSMA